MAVAGRLRRTLRHLAPQDGSPAARTAPAAAAAPLEPRMHAESDDASPGPELTASDIAFFKANGYLVKRRLLPAEDLGICVEKFWAAAPPCIGPDDPDSWVDPGRHDSWATETPEGYERGEHNRGGTRWTLHALGHDPEFLKVTAHHPLALRVVEGLIGGPVKLPGRNRVRQTHHHHHHPYYAHGHPPAQWLMKIPAAGYLRHLPAVPGRQPRAARGLAHIRVPDGTLPNSAALSLPI